MEWIIVGVIFVIVVFDVRSRIRQRRKGEAVSQDWLRSFWRHPQ